MYVCFGQVVGGKMTESGRLCAFITKVRKGSLADTVGHLRPGKHRSSVGGKKKENLKKLTRVMLE